MQPNNNNSDSNHASSANSRASAITTSHSSQGETLSTRQSSSLNFSTGVSAECLTALVRTDQLMEARERIRKEKANGEDLVTRLKQAKRVTAGFVWKEGTNRLGKTIFEVCKEKQLMKKKDQEDKMKKEKKAYFELKAKADSILSTGQPIDKLSNKELNIVLRSLKRDGDKKIPTRKSEMVELYQQWCDRQPLEFPADDASNDDELEPDAGNGNNDPSQVVEL